MRVCLDLYFPFAVKPKGFPAEFPALALSVSVAQQEVVQVTL